MASVQVSNDSTLNSERKTSNTLLPSYSELDLEMDEVNGRPRRPSKEGLLSQVQDDQDYENLRYDQDYQNLQQPPPHVRRSSLPVIRQQASDGEPHTVISISPDSEDSGSPRDGIPNAAKVNATANIRPQQGTLTPIQDEAPWYQSSTPSVMSHVYSSPASPTNGGVFPPINASASQKSLQMSFSNPISSRNGPRSYSSMSQSSNPSHSMGKAMMGQAAKGFSRSSNSMGRSVAQSSKQACHKVHSIPAGMDHFTDV